jgi:hypothetical protein
MAILTEKRRRKQKQSTPKKRHLQINYRMPKIQKPINSSKRLRSHRFFASHSPKLSKTAKAPRPKLTSLQYTVKYYANSSKFAPLPTYETRAKISLNAKQAPMSKSY